MHCFNSKTDEPDFPQMVKELEAAGWTAKSRVVWMAPWGAYFLGPYQAWRILRKTQ